MAFLKEMVRHYSGPGRVRLALAWRVDGPDGSVTYRPTRAQARMVLGRIRDALKFLAESKRRANAAEDAKDAATRRMLGMAPATDAEAINAEADADGDE